MEIAGHVNLPTPHSTVELSAFPFVSINGDVIKDTAGATVSIWDTSFHRGDGVFEVVRLLPRGVICCLDLHLKRLYESAGAVGCPLPPVETVRAWLEAAAISCATPIPTDQLSGQEPDKDEETGGKEKGEKGSIQTNMGAPALAPGCLRLIATKGGQRPVLERNSNVCFRYAEVPPSVVISWAPLPRWPDTFTLLPLLAPWHCAGTHGWETPIKWTSYGPNVVSSQRAKSAGYSDALLLSDRRLPYDSSSDAPASSPSSAEFLNDCHVLDGPNFAVSWIKGDTLYFPDAEVLGLLPSITQRLVENLARERLGLNTEKGVYPLRTVWEAEEVFVTSTTRGIIPVTALGETPIARVPHEKKGTGFSRTRRLQEALHRLHLGQE